MEITRLQLHSEDHTAVDGRMGEDRLNGLQLAIALNIQGVQMPEALDLIDDMLVEYTENGGQSLAEIGYGTVADALAEIGLSKSAIKTLLKGKMSVQRAVDKQRSAVSQARSKNDRPLHEDSREYHALRRSLTPLAAHVAIQRPPELRITDKIASR